MSQQTSELEQVLTQLIGEHRQLLALVEAHRKAMSAMDMARMEKLGAEQMQMRNRIAGIELRRKVAAANLAGRLGLKPDATLSQMAAVLPARRQVILGLRDELRGLCEQLSVATHVASRVAGAVMGHLNTAVRLVAGAAQHAAGTYTRAGTPRESRRLGVLEALA